MEICRLVNLAVLVWIGGILRTLKEESVYKGHDEKANVTFCILLFAPFGQFLKTFYIFWGGGWVHSLPFQHLHMARETCLISVTSAGSQQDQEFTPILSAGGVMSSQREWEVACGFSELEVSLAKAPETHSCAQISRRQNS